MCARKHPLEHRSPPTLPPTALPTTHSRPPNRTSHSPPAMTNWARHGIVLVIAVAFAGYQYSKTVNHLSKREEALTRQTSRAKGLVARNIDMVEYELLDVTSSNKAAHTLIVNRAAVPPLIVAEISPVGFFIFHFDYD